MKSAISSSDLRMLAIPVRLMPSVYCVTKLRETIPWGNSIYIQSMLIAKTNVSKRKCGELKQCRINLTSVVKGENGIVCEASYRVRYHAAHCGEAYTISKNLIIS
jgi:hypothetical protein